MKIFIDAGHGGADPGAVSKTNGLREANVNLDVALKLGALLKERGHTINYSRTSNKNVSLSERTRLANDWGAGYFISVHCNSVEGEQANGTETLIYRLGITAEKLADSIQDSLIAVNGLRSRGVRAQNLAVLRLTKMPAVLVELAFISNGNEANLLATDSFRQKCAEGIATGVANFLE